MFNGIVVKICTYYAVLEIDTRDNSHFITTLVQIVHLLFYRSVVERELGKNVVEVKEVMDLIKTAGLMKTVAGLSQCYEGLVKEFVVNIPEDIAD